MLRVRSITHNFSTTIRTMSTSEFPPASLKPIAQEVATLLKERQETVSVAETVRDGLVSVNSIELY